MLGFFFKCIIFKILPGTCRNQTIRVENLQHFGKLFFQVSEKFPPSDGQDLKYILERNRGSHRAGGGELLRDLAILVVEQFRGGLSRLVFGDDRESAESAE